MAEILPAYGGTKAFASPYTNIIAYFTKKSRTKRKMDRVKSLSVKTSIILVYLL